MNYQEFRMLVKHSPRPQQSKSRTSTGIYHVTRNHHNKYSYWRYEHKKPNEKVRRCYCKTLKGLEQKVRLKGWEWTILDTTKAEKTYKKDEGFLV